MSHYSDQDSTLSYQSTQYISPRKRSPRTPGGLRSYRSFCSDLTEALYEEEEEEDEEEEKEKEDGSLGKVKDWDNMGVLGLTAKLSRDTKTRQEVFLANDSFLRKASLGSHAM